MSGGGDGVRGALTPWWESALPRVQSELRAFLRARLPAMPDAHDDLVNETLLALAERVRREPGMYPAAWQSPGEPVSDEDRAYLLKLAQTILRRRVADLFRARARAWGRAGGASGSGTDEGEAVEPRAPALQERQAVLARMVRVCVAAMADLSDEDRELLTAVAEGDPGRALTDRERQRLRRARARLADAVRAALGDSAAELLRDD